MGVMEREKRTVSAMIELYCRGIHLSERELCEDCDQLLQYALGRLDRCSFGADKPICANCPVHCYNAVMRARIRDVMKYAGPKMVLRHPVLAVGHLLDKRKKPKASSGK